MPKSHHPFAWFQPKPFQSWLVKRIFEFWFILKEIGSYAYSFISVRHVFTLTLVAADKVSEQSWIRPKAELLKKVKIKFEFAGILSPKLMDAIKKLDDDWALLLVFWINLNESLS